MGTAHDPPSGMDVAVIDARPDLFDGGLFVECDYGS
jgi:hypothetical protein